MCTNTSTTASVSRSESECTASAIIAAEQPTMPLTNLNATRATLMALPASVTLRMVFSRLFVVIILKFGCKVTTFK